MLYRLFVLLIVTNFLYGCSSEDSSNKAADIDTLDTNTSSQISTDSTTNDQDDTASETFNDSDSSVDTNTDSNTGFDSDSDTGSDSLIDTDSETATSSDDCSELLFDVIGPDNFNSCNFLPQFEVITTENALNTFIDDCSDSLTPDDLPEINWSAQEVIRLSGWIDCALNFTVNGVQLCDTHLIVNAAVNRDYCYCDYEEMTHILIIAEQSDVDDASLIETNTIPCEEVICPCIPEPKDGCEGCY